MRELDNQIEDHFALLVSVTKLLHVLIVEEVTRHDVEANLLLVLLFIGQTECMLASEHEVDDQAERPEVSLRARFALLDELRRAVKQAMLDAWHVLLLLDVKALERFIGVDTLLCAVRLDEASVPEVGDLEPLVTVKEARVWVQP